MESNIGLYLYCTYASFSVWVIVFVSRLGISDWVDGFLSDELLKFLWNLQSLDEYLNFYLNLDSTEKMLRFDWDL